MYQITRRTPHKMQFKLGEEVLEFTLNESVTVNKFAEIQGELAKLKDDNTPEASVKIGECIARMMYLIFGDQAKKILEFFEDDYVEMLEQIYPYIMKVIVPELKKRSKARAKAWK